MVIAIASDHAGYQAKQCLVDYMIKHDIQHTDMGVHSETSVDYPDYAHTVAKAIIHAEADKGILICGSGQGMCMAANKHAGIRAALCWNKEIAILSRKHNNANILCLPGRFLNEEELIGIFIEFLNTDFEGGRHEQRIKKMEITGK